MGDLLTLADREERFAALTHTQAVWVALVCAERLVSGDTADRHDALREALDTAWDALRTRQTESAAALAARLEDRDDVDDDPVAATTFALQAVAGMPEAARWGADRGIDDAFERVPHQPGVRVAFGPLDPDTASEVVQQELRWQLAAADVVSHAKSPDEVKAWVQEQPGPTEPCPS